MLTRRSALATALPAALVAQAHAAGGFEALIASVRAQAAAEGVRKDVLDAAFAGVTPNPKVIEKDQKQAEFTMTWARYRALVIGDKRISDGRAAVTQNRALFGKV